jgi:TetR/AcrR family transcriptional regulator, copper-responsive repressor
MGFPFCIDQYKMEHALPHRVKCFIVITMKKADHISNARKKPLGRPRSFDRDLALNAAMLQFWEHGYEATSISDLAEAMDLNPPSIYGAFGDKRALFEESVDAYQKGPGCFAERAMSEETDTRRAFERLLMDAAANFTDGTHPPGCMVVLSALNCTDEDADVRERLAARRRKASDMFAGRVADASARGEIPSHVSPSVLANLIVTVFQGMSVRARDGATREELEAVARHTMSLWPVSSS